MALRVKKLARQLKRDPIEVLGLLHAVGYVRYKSISDMVADPAIRRVHRAIQEGVQPLPVEADIPAPKKKKTEEPERRKGGDLMAALMPGVTPLGGGPAPAPAPVEAPAPVKPSPVVEAAEPSPVEVVREPDPPSPAAENAEVLALRETVARLEADKAALEARLAEVKHPPSLRAVLEQRGLRGRDELERTLAGLAKRRLLLDALGAATMADGGRLADLLRSRVRLVEGAPPEGFPDSLVSVAVAPERAELPRPSVLDQQVERVGEQLMLHGRRQLAVVGGDPLDLHLLAHRLDERVELLRGDLGTVEPDVAVVVCWGVPADESIGALAAQGALLIEAGGSLVEVCGAVVQRLASA